MVFSGDYSTVRQPRVDGVSSGEDDAYYVEFCRRAARLLYLKVLEMMGGPVDEVHTSCCAAGMHLFVARHAC